jgi:hypothetical protein
VAAWQWQHGGSGSGSGSAVEGCLRGRVGRAGGWGGMVVLVKLGRGVPCQVPRAIGMGGPAEGRESEGRDKGKGNVNGDRRWNSGKGGEGHNVGGVSVRR